MTITYNKLVEHNKASEIYVVSNLVGDFGTFTNIYIPIHYRRTGVNIDETEPSEIQSYLNNVLKEIENNYPFDNWINGIIKQYRIDHSRSVETFQLLSILKPLEKLCIQHNYRNANWARRFQDLKEYGLTISTYLNEKCSICNNSTTQIMLLPIGRPQITHMNGYEVIDSNLKKRIINLLQSIDIYEYTNRQTGLLPDHKFPEIRWGHDTKKLDIKNMTDKEIIEKFQLINNQRNQQKREQCRKCYQTKQRGTVFGINYYYHGGKMWDSNIPEAGKDAELGCVGCAWYDLKRWRNSLNEIVLSTEK